jgi:hypothetical protein
LLYIFNITDLDFEKHEKEINDEVEHVFNIVSKNKKFLKCIKKCSSFFNVKDLFIAFTILMSYDFLHLSHPCICEILDNNDVSNEKIAGLLKLME